MSGQLDIQLRKSGPIYVIDVKGEMDLFNAFKLKDVVKALMERHVQQYVINLADLEYIDSSGIGALLFVYGELRKGNRVLVVAGARGSVKRVIELTKLVGYLPLAPDVNDALGRLRGHGLGPQEGTANGRS